MKVVRNAFQCRQCGETVESTHRHHYATCECGNFTDGGHDYVRRGGYFDDMIDLCEFEDDEDERSTKQ